MKPVFKPIVILTYKVVFCLLTILFFLCVQQSIAQCDVNAKYDKIISGYHSSIALKTDGVFGCWGQNMENSGSDDATSPQDITSANYAALGSATPLKAAIGGSGSSDEFIVLTTDGLYAWGYRGGMLSSTLTTSTAFQKIGTPSGGDAITKLPAGVTPAMVAMLFGTYQTLALVTTDGYVWVITQSSANLQGDGTVLSTTTWHKVKTNSTTYLSGVTAVRGQVSSSNYNALMAVTTSGAVYTWGTSTYMGDGTVSTSKNYATQMTLPAEFASSVPKLVGVTGGIKNAPLATKNTLYVLGTSGNLYALGDNQKKQCGDFTTTERTSWVRVQKSSTSGDYLMVNFFTCQEHNAKTSPCVAAITNNADIYTWGENDGLMIGRATSPNTYDPGVPNGFTAGTDKAITAEQGGHTLVYLKVGSSQFCYVGHKTDGSMGDGTTANTNISSFDCTNTPQNFAVCGSSSVTASAALSVISAAVPTIPASGTSTDTITIRLKDASGTNLTSSGGTVAVLTSAGTLGSVVDNNDGTYTVILTSSITVSTANITFSVNGTTATNNTTVDFTTVLPIEWGNISAYKVAGGTKVEWTTVQEMNINYFEAERSLNGKDWSAVANTVKATNLINGGKYSITDNNYTGQKVYYRVKQVDMDGRISYSSVVVIIGTSGKGAITAFPVPARNSFRLSNVNIDELKEIGLYNNHGQLVKKWKTGAGSYDVQALPAGIYTLKVSMISATEYIRITILK